MKSVDGVVGAYLVASAVVIASHASLFPASRSFVVAHLGAAAAVYALRFLPALPRVLRFARDWYPVVAFPVLYKEVELLAGAFGNWGLTEPLQRLEASLFGGQPSLYLSSLFPYVALSEYLHFCYLSFLLWLPLVGGYWYFRGRLRAFHELLFLVSVTFTLSYLFYVLFPVDSPFYLFEPLEPPLAGQPFYELVHFVSSRGGARGGAFPSTHVSVATVIWLLVYRYERRLFWWLTPVYLGLVLATIYGRFHYALDVAAGWFLAAGLCLLKTRLDRRRSSRAPSGTETAPPPGLPPRSRAT